MSSKYLLILLYLCNFKILLLKEKKMILVRFKEESMQVYTLHIKKYNLLYAKNYSDHLINYSENLIRKEFH